MLKIGHKNELFDTSKINLVTNNLNKFTEDSIMQIVFKSIDSTFRDISYYENEEDRPKEEDAVKCKKCDDGIMVKRKGRYGFFLGCNNYPKCKTIVNIKK